MNKKLLGLVMAGVLATTSLPAVTASAATSATKTNTATSSVASTVPIPWAATTILAGAELYSQPYSDCYSKTVQADTAVSIKLYSGSWYAIKFANGSIYYIWGTSYIRN